MEDGPGLMDELFEKIKSLEAKNKILAEKVKELNEKIEEEEISEVKEYFTPKFNNEQKKKLDEYNKEKEKFKSLITPYFEKSSNETASVSDKVPLNILFNFLKSHSDIRRLVATEKDKDMKIFEEKLGKEFGKPTDSSVFIDLEKMFKGRILVEDNVNYIIQIIDKTSKKFLVTRLYDPNGIKINIEYHKSHYNFHGIPIEKIFDSAYILSKEESNFIIAEHKADNNKNNKLMIFYISKSIPGSIPPENELIPYRIDPNTIDINQYEINVQNNNIHRVYHRETTSYVFFDSICIGNDYKRIGLVSSSVIKVYTTMYSKDVVNVLHMHLNDTSSQITIEAEYIDANDSILNHKIFKKDALGQRLSYKLIFRNNKLEKIYYFVSDNYIDEPPFEEIRIKPSSFIKILAGKYKDLYARVNGFPQGLFARSGNDDLKFKKSSSEIISGFNEGECLDRHFAELEGLVDIEVMFKKSKDFHIEKIDSINLKIPVCHIIPLTPQEEIAFQKTLIIAKEETNIRIQDKIEEWKKDINEYEGYLKDDSKLNEMNLEELKSIMEKVNNMNLDSIKKEISEGDLEENNEIFNKIEDVKQKITGTLMMKIRLAALGIKNK